MVDLMVENKLHVPMDVERYNKEGRLLTQDEADALSEDAPYALWYINADNVLRKVEYRDPEIARIAMKKEPVIKDINRVDCQNLNRILERIYDRDQDNRSDNLMDEQLDLANLAAVEQILEKCGMPSIQTAGDKGMSAIWLVIQHASAEKRKQYFPMLLEASKKGDLERQDIALMQDRMLMDDGQPQLYGSQITMNEDGEYELYDLKNPEGVDARRQIMGMGPLSEYVVHWGLNFEVPQIPADANEK